MGEGNDKVGQPSTVHRQKGIAEGEEDVWISGCGVWTETEKNEVKVKR